MLLLITGDALETLIPTEPAWIASGDLGGMPRSYFTFPSGKSLIEK